MEKNFVVGLSFGITSAAITTLGLIVGLEAATSSVVVVLGGIFTIAIADAFSDALGMHISRESEAGHSAKEIWLATLATFMAKFFFALTFVVPFLIFPIKTAVMAGVIWGLLIIAILSFYIAKREKNNVVSVVGEHLLIAIVVILLTNWAGGLIARVFK